MVKLSITEHIMLILHSCWEEIDGTSDRRLFSLSKKARSRWVSPLSANQAPNWQVGRAGSTWTVHRCSAVLGKLFYEPRGAVVLIRGKGGA